MNDAIMVSVCCTAFNHEKYIRKCLDGFVMQKTSFKYEVIINDDASTDKTAEIIREYEQKYPEIIKPIYQTQNQYSIDSNITFNILFPRVKGKYIALCEGDDFWNDPLKLQRQVDAMEEHPECHMCVNRVTCTTEYGYLKKMWIPSFELPEGVIHSDDFLKMVCTQYAFQTSGYFFRAEDIWNYTHPIPKFREICPVGDEAYMLYFGQLGDVYYIPTPMSCYRQNSSGGWSVNNSASKKKEQQHNLKMIDVLLEYDAFTGYKYHNICELGIWQRKLLNADNKKDYRELIKSGKQIYKTQDKNTQIKVLLGAYCPMLLKSYNLFSRIRLKIRQKVRLKKHARKTTKNK